MSERKYQAGRPKKAGRIRIIQIFVFLFIFAAFPCASFPVYAAEATPTKSTVLVDNKVIAFEAYNIENHNYFKLRDLAYILNGTSKQFGVTWNAVKNAVTLERGKKYISTGEEMAMSGNTAPREATPTASKIIVEGLEDQKYSFTAYNIAGNNYFKLREIADKIDFGVTWDSETNCIGIDTSISYSSDRPSRPDKKIPVPEPSGSIAISLPFSETDTPFQMMPMGETIEHPDPPNPGGHPGIDFMWQKSIDIIASVDGTISKIQEAPNHKNTWDVFIATDEFYVGYTTLAKVDDKIKVGTKVTAGQKVGESGFFGHSMIHWEFGIDTGEGRMRICPMKYLTDASRQRIVDLWASVKWSEMKSKFPHICNYAYRCDYCIENGY